MRFDLLFVPDTDLITLQVPGQNVSFVDTFDTVKPKGTSINTYACVPFHSLHGTVSLIFLKLNCSFWEGQGNVVAALCGNSNFKGISLYVPPANLPSIVGELAICGT